MLPAALHTTSVSKCYKTGLRIVASCAAVMSCMLIVRYKLFAPYAPEHCHAAKASAAKDREHTLCVSHSYHE